jgi:NTP pyrophosphatase (non-canonical NTP hydrolase)
MDPAHFLLGMSGEVGEMINACKHEFLWPDELPTSVGKTVEEAGDVLWYLTALLSSVGLTLEDAMVGNVKKLTERYGEDYYAT